MFERPLYVQRLRIRPRTLQALRSYTPVAELRNGVFVNCGWCKKVIAEATYYCRHCGWHLGKTCLRSGRCPKCDGRV